MSVAATAGTPQLADQGLIPDLYAKQFNVEYWATTLLPRITTGRFYEQALKQGDKVTVANVPTVTTKPYRKHQELDTQIPESAPTEMTVDRARYFNLLIDDIDVKQSHLAIADKYMNTGVNQTQEDIETEFFEAIYSAAHADNQGATAGAKSAAYNLGAAGSPVAVTKDNTVDVITRLMAALGEQNARKGGKSWIVFPEWFRYVFLNSDAKNAALMGDESSVLRTGQLGKIDNCYLYTSNLLYTTTTDESTGTYVMAGNMDAISFISQLTKTRKLESETTFGHKLSGLNVYDWSVRKPEGLVALYCYKG